MSIKKKNPCSLLQGEIAVYSNAEGNPSKHRAPASLACLREQGALQTDTVSLIHMQGTTHKKREVWVLAEIMAERVISSAFLIFKLMMLLYVSSKEQISSLATLWLEGEAQ